MDCQLPATGLDGVAVAVAAPALIVVGSALVFVVKRRGLRTAAVALGADSCLYLQLTATGLLRGGSVTIHRNGDDDYVAIYTDLAGNGSWSELIVVAPCLGNWPAGDRLVALGTTASRQPITSNTLVLTEAC